jgi:hypothetical protein
MLWRNISSDVAAQNQCFYAGKPDRDNLAARSIPIKLRWVVRRCDAKKPDHENEKNDGFWFAMTAAKIRRLFRGSGCG